MPDDIKSGQSSFLDRINSKLDTINEDPPATETPPVAAELEALEPKQGAAPKKAPTGDPLDDLAPDETPPVEEKPEAKPKTEPVSEDILDTFDPADREKIQALIDARVAAEVTATESAGGAFKRIKAENRELEAKIKELSDRAGQGDPEALKAATARIAELEQAQKVYEQRDSVLQLEETKAWKDAVVAPLTSVLEASDRIADRYGVDKNALADALELTDRRELSTAINKLLGEDAVEADKFELFDLARRVEGVYAKRTELRANATEALTEAESLLEKEREAEALKARQGREQAAAATIERITTKAKFIADIVGEETLQAVAADIAERDIASLSEEDRAWARVAAKSIRPLAQRIMKLEAELQEASDQLAARKKAAPGAVAGSSGTPGEEAPEPTGKFADRLSARIGALA